MADGGHYFRARPSLYTGSLARLISGDSDAWAVAGYLICGPHANSIGLYRLPLTYVAVDLGIPMDRVEAAIEKLCGTPLGRVRDAYETRRGRVEDAKLAPFCLYDLHNSMCFVVEGAKHQWGEPPNPSRNDVKGLMKRLPEMLCEAKISFLINAFHDRYGVSWSDVLSTMPDVVLKAFETRTRRVEDASRTRLLPSPSPSPSPTEEIREECPVEAPGPAPNPSLQVAEQLLEHWNTYARPKMLAILGKRKAPAPVRMTAANRRTLMAALRAGHTPEDIRTAMDHASHDMWLMGCREGSGEKTDLATVLLIRGTGSRPLDRVEQLIAKTEPDRGFPTEMVARRSAWERHHGR